MNGLNGKPHRAFPAWQWSKRFECLAKLNALILQYIVLNTTMNLTILCEKVNSQVTLKIEFEKGSGIAIKSKK